MLLLLKEFSHYGFFIKKLDVTYKFWKDADNVTLTSHFTRKDLKNPPLYKNEGFYEEEQ